MSWTPEKVEKLRELWGKGYTASQIAEKLGDTTRNSVIGLLTDFVGELMEEDFFDGALASKFNL